MTEKKGIYYYASLARGRGKTATPEERERINEFVNTKSEELKRTAGPPLDLKEIFKRGDENHE